MLDKRRSVAVVILLHKNSLFCVLLPIVVHALTPSISQMHVAVRTHLSVLLKRFMIEKVWQLIWHGAECHNIEIRWCGFM